MKKLRFLVLVLLAGILVASTLLSSCDGSDPATTDTSTTTTQTSATTTHTGSTTSKPEGTFTFGIDAWGQGNFIPWMTLMEDASISQGIYESLGMPGWDGNPMPMLAESWEWSEDYLTLTMHLRKGIQWQDGWGEFTSEDVKYSYEGVMSEDSVMGKKESWRKSIDSIEAVDPYTVDINFNTPSIDILSEFIQEYQNSQIVCKNYIDTVGIEEASANPVGTGPWRLVEYSDGDYAKLQAVEDHWRAVPEFEYLVIKLVPEESTRIGMLKTGQIDACIISPTNNDDLVSSGFHTESQYGGANSFIIFGGALLPQDERYVEGYHNTDIWWTDVRIREAMNIAIDRDALNRTFENGTAGNCYSYTQFPGFEDLEPYPYDPDRARELLAEAGYPDGFELELINSPYHPGVPMISKEGEAIAGYWEAIGITVTITPLDFMSYWPTLVSAENKGHCYTYRMTFEANPWTGCVFFIENQGGSSTLAPDQELRTLANEALAATTLEDRTPIYQEMMQIAYDEYYFVPILLVPQLFASNPEKAGYWPRSTSTYYFNYEYIEKPESLNTFRLFEYTDQFTREDFNQ